MVRMIKVTNELAIELLLAARALRLRGYEDEAVVIPLAHIRGLAAALLEAATKPLPNARGLRIRGHHEHEAVFVPRDHARALARALWDAESTIELAIANTGADPLEVTPFELSGSESFEPTFGHGNWSTSAETASGVESEPAIVVEPVTGAHGDSDEPIVFRPDKRARADPITKDSLLPEGDEE